MRAIAITLGIFSILCLRQIKIQETKLIEIATIANDLRFLNRNMEVDNENLRYQVVSCRQLVREQ